jgi:hypothetical protein
MKLTRNSNGKPFTGKRIQHVKAPLLILEDNGISALAMRAWLWLFHHKSRDGVSRMKPEKLATKLNKSLRTVLRALKELEEREWLSRHDSSGNHTYDFETPDGLLPHDPASFAQAAWETPYSNA